MRMTQKELDAITRKPGYTVRDVDKRRGERGPDRQKRKEGSGQRKTYPDYSRMLIAQLELVGALSPVPEYRFYEGRKWRLDLAYPDRRLAIEVDGAVHRIKGQFYRDLEKHQALFFEGWRLLRVSTAQVRSGAALAMVRRALG